MEDYYPTGAPSEDWCTERGAHRLAAKIRHYWAKRGVFVNTSVEEMPTVTTRRPVFQIRSDLVLRCPS